jgi:flagellar biosynthesis protein FliP
MTRAWIAGTAATAWRRTRTPFLSLALVLLSASNLGATDPVWMELADPKGYTSAIKILLTLTLISFVPSLMLSVTSFTRLVIVFSMLRQAMGTQQAPPNQVMVGLALFMTLFVMRPVWTEIGQGALTPYLDGQIEEKEAWDRGWGPLRDFMLRQTRTKDLGVFVEMAGIEPPRTVEDIPTTVLVPAFITSELKTAFEIAFLLYIPFLVIDMVVASVLMSMGMMLLPPIMISLPFKLLLFVLADGWNLLVMSLVRSF